MDIFSSALLKTGQIYTRNNLQDQFGITDATLRTGIFQPKGHNSIWIFITEQKPVEATQYVDSLEGDVLYWEGQQAGRKDHLIAEHRQRGTELLVFYRRNKREYPAFGFRYEGRFEYVSHRGSNPAKFVLKRISEINKSAFRNAYLLTWNPRNWDWHDLDKDISTVTNSGKLNDRWSCITRNLPVGSRVFLMRLGEPPKGMIASGVSMSLPYESEHWNEEKQTQGGTAWYIDIEFDFITKEPVISLNELEQPPFWKFNWTPQGSGTRIPQEIALSLELEWAKRTSRPLHSSYENLALEDFSPEKEDILARLETLNRRMEGVNPESVSALVFQTIRRDAQIVQALKEYFGFECQFPGCGVQILKRSGHFYIEVAHVKPVSKKGQSIIGNLLVLCPNHHKEFDFGDLQVDHQSLKCLSGKLNGRAFKIDFPVLIKQKGN